jgi:catechol 2,3-dioxygenase
MKEMPLSTDKRLPDDTKIGNVHLRVPDLSRALGFYERLLGFKVLQDSGGTVLLSPTGKPPHRIVLTESPKARPRPRGTTGLFHIAIRFPSRESLSQELRQLIDQKYRLHGFSDHGVSEAIYLADPDGNGVELYVDRPRSDWPRDGGEIAMMTDPLDIDNLLGASKSASWSGIHPGTDIGHVHLQVSNLRRSEDFYRGLLGFEVTQRSYPGALFLAAGGYHHHVGLNVWAGEGAPPPPPDAAGLVSFSVTVPTLDEYSRIRSRLETRGLEVHAEDPANVASGMLIHDPDGNGVVISVNGQT